MTTRQQVRGILIVPEKYKVISSGKEHVATRYRIYADRARNMVLLDVTLSGTKKDSYTYNNDSIYDDQILFFTTNVQFSDGTWGGESPLTRIVLRKEQVSTTGIIVTPLVTTDLPDLSGGFTIYASDYIRYEGSAGHESTSYKIEDDITGDIIFEKPDDMDNLYSLKVPNDILSVGRVYRISVRFKDSLGRYSNYGSMMYNYGNFLYTMFPNDIEEVNYGDNIVLKSASTEIVLEENPIIELYVDGLLIGSPVFLNNKIIYDTKQLEPGDLVKCVITSGFDKREVSIYVRKINTEISYDYDFELANVFETINIGIPDTAFNQYGSVEFKDGFIYGFDVNRKLVRFKYDDTSKKVYGYQELKDYNDIDELVNVGSKIVENPIDGNILLFTITTGITDTTQSLFVIDINTYNIITEITLDLSIGGFIYDTNPIVIKDTLYLFSGYKTDTMNQKTVYTLSLLDYTLSLLGTITFNSLDANSYGNASCSGLTPVLYKGDILFINKGGDVGTYATVDKSVYRLNLKTMGLETVTTLDGNTGIPYGKEGVGAVLKNGKIGIIYGQCAFTDGTTPVRTINGIYYIDVDTGAVDISKMNTVSNTISLSSIISMRDGSFLFTDGINCQRFK